MSKLNDWQCNDCGKVFEDFERPKCECGSHNVRMVFTPGSVQFVANHASTVDHVIQHNNKKMKEIEEEDSTPGSQFQKDYEAISHGIDWTEKRKLQVGYGS